MTGNGPPGQWGEILVGQFWTPSSDLAIVSSTAVKRQATSAAWQEFSDQLWQTLSGPISPEIQQGMTADVIRQKFEWSAKQADDVAGANYVISKAHSSAHDAAAELNSQLAAIAHDGDAKIKEIQNSKDTAPVKLGKITDIVMDCQRRAVAAAAPCTQSIFEAMQTILDRRGIPESSRQFVQNHGMDSAAMFGSPNKDTVRQQAQAMVNESGSPAETSDATAPLTNPTALAVGDNRAAPPHGSATASANASSAGGNRSPSQTPPPATIASSTSVGDNRTRTPAPTPTPNTGIPNSPTLTTANAPAPTPTASPPSTSLPPLPPATSTPTLPQAAPPPTAPGAPPVATTGSVPATPVAPQMPQSQPITPQVPVTPTLPTTAIASVFDTPPPAHAPAVETPPPPAAAAPVIAAPTITGTATPPPPPAAAGPLPTYGADIRPPAPAAATPTPPTTTPAGAPMSAPVNPSSASGHVATPVTRHLTTPATTPAVLGRQLAAATVGATAAGATSAQATVKARLQRLVDFVARQEPRLRWAVGERSDGSTVLVTDLAGGWIPPGIAIPSAAKLLDPGHRRNDIDTLLGEVDTTASHTPPHYPPPADDAAPTPTSTRARQTQTIDELGWELGQVTRWRDGLPRLAHTLAKATSAGTGVLDSEIDLLRTHLSTVASQVLGSYPDSTNTDALGNWQLLAVIDALAAKDKTAAHYHFAWFQALSQATSLRA